MQVRGGKNSLSIFITGNARTGETFFFKLLKNQANPCYGKIVVKVSALRGVEARLIIGSTLHHALKLPIPKVERISSLHMLAENYLSIMRLQWIDKTFLFIGKISMVYKRRYA